MYTLLYIIDKWSTIRSIVKKHKYLMLY